jgi:hypothetical protein
MGFVAFTTTTTSSMIEGCDDQWTWTEGKGDWTRDRYGAHTALSLTMSFGEVDMYRSAKECTCVKHMLRERSRAVHVGVAATGANST